VSLLLETRSQSTSNTRTSLINLRSWLIMNVTFVHCCTGSGFPLSTHVSGIRVSTNRPKVNTWHGATPGQLLNANSVLGARTNYEAGAAGMAAALTGRTPAYGFHLDAVRHANVRVRVAAPMQDFADWGALGAIIGERCRGYWTVPSVELTGRSPTTDEMKHFGASLASFGSMAMYHIVGVTPEAPTFETANGGRELIDEFEVRSEDIENVFSRDLSEGGPIDLVVFTAPQLSFFEMKRIADGLKGKKVSDDVRLIITTNTMQCKALDDEGHLATIRDAGGIVLQGTCWYIMDPAAQRVHFGWHRLATNSAKLVNITSCSRLRPSTAPH